MGTVSSSTTGSTGVAPLDEVMLAMDVVDTLRRRERIAKDELDDSGRAADLKERLRKIYSAQGIEVPDQVIEQGVAALREDRFTYQPPPRSFKTRLALIYINRGRWGRWLGGIIGLGILVSLFNYFAFVAPTAALPDELAQAHAEAARLAQRAEDRVMLDLSLQRGEASLREHDIEGTRAALKQLSEARQTLGQEYLIRIVNRPGQPTGVWRIPDVNSDARNYYIIVEAVDPTGRALEVLVTNEETRETEATSIWGLRVDEDTFRAVARDKQDDGIITRDRFGYKARGELKPRYEMKTTGGAITHW